MSSSKLLPSDVFTKATQDGFRIAIGQLPVAGPDDFAEPFDAVGDAGAVNGLGDAVGINDHDVTGPQGILASPIKLEIVLFQSQRKTKIEGVVPFKRAIFADDQNLFVLPADGNDFILIVKQAQREIAIAVHTASVVVDDAVENFEELPALVMSARQQEF